MTIPVDVDMLIKDAIHNKFYGRIELQFQDGRIVMLHKHETIKPSTSSRSTRDEALNEPRDAAYNFR